MPKKKPGKNEPATHKRSLQLLSSMPRGGPVCHQLRFSPDSTMLSAAAYDRRVHLYDIASKKRLWHSKVHSAPAMCTVFAPGNAYMLSVSEWKQGRKAQGSEILFLETRDGSVQQRLEIANDNGEEAYGITVSEDGRWAVCQLSLDTWRLAVIDLRTREVARYLSVENEWIDEFDISPDSTTVSATSRERMFSWKLATGKMLKNAKLPGHSSPPRYSPCGSRIALSQWNKGIYILDSKTLKIISTIDFKSKQKEKTRDIRFGECGGEKSNTLKLTTINEYGDVTQWDAKTGVADFQFTNPLNQDAAHRTVNATRLAPCLTMCAVADSKVHLLSLRD